MAHQSEKPFSFEIASGSHCRKQEWNSNLIRKLKVEEHTTEEEWREDRLLPMVYEELRRMAALKMQKERVGHTLQPTALVHEAWLRLRSSGGAEWENKAHFMGAAAHAMRRILVENARRKSSCKRTPNDRPVDFELSEAAGFGPTDHVLMIHESLEVLEKEDPEAAKVVILKFFSGLDSREIARMSGSSVRSVERRWTVAKARLYQIIRAGGSGGAGDIP